MPSNQRNRLRRAYAFHHARRFLWLRDKITGLNRKSVSILELGCGDARSLDYVPVPVDTYLGFDAGMRSGIVDGKGYGLEAARQRFAQNKAVCLQQSTDPSDVAAVQEKFDLILVMETFEYLGTSNLEAYASILSERLRPDGVLLATMPNEKGVPLLIKALGAKLSGIPRSQYTTAEFMNALAGRMNRVPRMERARKGFDYEAIARLVRRFLQHIHLESVDFRGLPLSLSLNVGLIASHSPLRPSLV